jgi:hypothetical protein
MKLPPTALSFTVLLFAATCYATSTEKNHGIRSEECVSLFAGSGYIGETIVEFAATALKRGKEFASLAST